MHLSSNVDNIIISDILTVLKVFLLLSVSWRFLEGFDNQGRGRKYHFNLGLSFWMVSFTVILRPSQSLLALVMSSPTFFWTQTQGANLLGGADTALTSPPVCLRYKTTISLESNWCGMVDMVCVRCTWIWDNWRHLYLRLLPAESQKLVFKWQYQQYTFTVCL